ncbi:MAG: menaquinone biosynthesis decarboxylase [Bacteroidia bacterium]|nr:menaquinone biosynthesis decarboxylase [Bacteroidia bacterium]
MPYTGLSDFICDLEKHSELHRIKTFVDPVLEITEITDRISKSGGNALLFESTGTSFPLLINAFGSDKRMAMALSQRDLDQAAVEIASIFDGISESRDSLLKKISSIPVLVKISGYLPSHVKGKGICQQVVHRNPDLSILPVIKCWPHDGGRFITLPLVHTIHPLTGKTNVGMYRMQILDNNTTAMHWQRHKTGANHFEEWKKTGRKMPVSVALGGDPVYTYAATAPLPENIDEYILAGFLRKKKVNLVRCITNDLYVPSDADIVIEGYVDPAEEPVLEGPFGDHTGFYSLADYYPKLHVTCITHSHKAVYPATVVGIPPMEDVWFAKATEKIFLAPLKLVILPETEDFHMPEAGVAHNLVIVKIRKSYPGQGKKVISSLMGAGQMMFTKYLVVVSGDVDIRNYRQLSEHVFRNTTFKNDLLFMSGPLDVLDHTSDVLALGGKMGIDATIKFKEEKPVEMTEDFSVEMKVVVTGLNQSEDRQAVAKSKKEFAEKFRKDDIRLILAVDKTVDVNDMYQVAWQVLGNSDPSRDAELVPDNILYIDGTIKAYRDGGFMRKWPNVVCSSKETIECIDRKWESLGIGDLISSPSIKNSRLLLPGNDEVITNS